MRRFSIVIILASFVALVGAIQASAQAYKFTRKKHYISVGGALNSMHYFGDLAPINRESIDVSTDLSFTRPNISAYIQYRFLPRITARGMLSFGLLAGDDRNAKENPDEDFNFRGQRNLHFRSTITEIAALLVVDLFANQGVYYRRPKIPIPYITFGIAAFHFNPQGREIAPSNEPGLSEAERYLRGTPTDNWVNLKDFKTEGEDYSNIAIAIPFGIGVRYKLTNHVDIGLEISARYTLTDYIDDVSGDYIDYSDYTPEQIGYAYRSLSPEWSNGDTRDPELYENITVLQQDGYVIGNTALPGEIRGSSDRDVYGMVGIHANYIFGGSVRSPKFR